MILSKYTPKNTLSTKIPVIGVPIVNGVHWLKRLIESIDYPVEELFIINNNGRDQITEELDALLKIKHPFIDRIKVCHLPHNIGVSGAWNLIIKSYIMSPYWIICNNDVAFTPGFLEEMLDKALDPETEIVWPPTYTFYDCLGTDIGSFSCFLFKESVIQKCNLFDENFYPAYCEDCDYLLKIKVNNIKMDFVITPHYHGEGLSYLTGSQTIKSETEDIAKKIYFAHDKNIEYMDTIWGSGWKNVDISYDKIRAIKETDTSVYNALSNNRLYNLRFNKQKYLGF